MVHLENIVTFLFVDVNNVNTRLLKFIVCHSLFIFPVTLFIFTTFLPCPVNTV